jgi:hypothetical protein
MNERDFWVALEFRVSGEFAEMADRSLRAFWCDGFIPTTYMIEDAVQRISGRAWICRGQKQEAWAFTLFFPSPVASRDAVDWSTLLPADNATKWLEPDTERHTLNMYPQLGDRQLHR